MFKSQVVAVSLIVSEVTVPEVFFVFVLFTVSSYLVIENPNIMMWMRENCG